MTNSQKKWAVGRTDMMKVIHKITITPVQKLSGKRSTNQNIATATVTVLNSKLQLPTALVMVMAAATKTTKTKTKPLPEHRRHVQYILAQQ